MFPLKRKLDSLEDLIQLEKFLRVIYKTEDGSTCQALMTFEYISWRNKITRQLAKPSDTGEPICAFLCGYKLFFSKQTCFVTQLLPYLPCEQNKSRKRKFDITISQTNSKHTCI
jgi:hypothetical protein